MKTLPIKIKVLLAILVGLFALTQSKAQDVVNRNTWFNAKTAFRVNNTGTSANRIMGVSAAGPGYTGSFMNYIYVGDGLSLSNDSLIVSNTGSIAWLTTGNTITGNKWLGTNGNRSLHIRTNATEYALIDSTGRIRFGATNTLPLFNSTALNQTHLATNGSYAIRSTNGPITLQSTGSEGVGIGVSTVENSNKLQVLGNSYFDGKVGIGVDSAIYKIDVVDSYVGSIFQPYLQVGYDNTEPYSFIGNKHNTGDSLGLAEFANTDINLTSKTAEDLINLTMRTSGAYYLGVYNTGGEIMRVDGATGNVGINTTSPSAKLHIQGATNDTVTVAAVYNSDNNNIFNVHNDKKVGINQAAPIYALEVVGDVNITDTQGSNQAFVTASCNDNLAAIGYQSDTSTSVLFFTQNAIYTSDNSTATNFGIGTASPTEKLEVAGNVKVDSALIQPYTVITDSTANIPNNVSAVLLDYGALVLTDSLSLPSTPINGQTLVITTKQFAVTSLTLLPAVNLQTGVTISTITVNAPIRLRYYSADAIWIKE